MISSDDIHAKFESDISNNLVMAQVRNRQKWPQFLPTQTGAFEDRLLTCVTTKIFEISF